MLGKDKTEKVNPHKALKLNVTATAGHIGVLTKADTAKWLSRPASNCKGK